VKSINEENRRKEGRSTHRGREMILNNNNIVGPFGTKLRENDGQYLFKESGGTRSARRVPCALAD